MVSQMVMYDEESRRITSVCERLGREEVAAGPAGAKKDDPWHVGVSGQAVSGMVSRLITARTTRSPSGRRRVSARISPIPKATAIIDEPP